MYAYNIIVMIIKRVTKYVITLNLNIMKSTEYLFFLEFNAIKY